VDRGFQILFVNQGRNSKEIDAARKSWQPGMKYTRPRKGKDAQNHTVRKNTDAIKAGSKFRQSGT
jgi:hypothetical protein